ncbi:MAG: hypothetical protein ACE5GJ_08620 [Gemmatimonadota bacterium]
MSDAGPTDAPNPLPPSPASRGVNVGLFLALIAAFSVLWGNQSWLLPAVDADGILTFYAAEAMSVDAPAVVPIAPWNGPGDIAGLSDRSVAVPWVLSRMIRSGLRTHVAALWYLALTLAAVVLTAAWVAGGAAGSGGAVLAGLLLMVSPLVVGEGTTVGPELLVTAVVGLQLGLMTYRPRWAPAYGAAAALAWLVHPVGAGAVAAAILWPLMSRGEFRSPARHAVAAAVPAAFFLLTGPFTPGIPTPPALLERGSVLGGLVPTVAGILRWAGAGLPGAAGLVAGAGVLAGLLLLLRWDAATTSRVSPNTPWYAPQAPDLLAQRARPAALVLALSLAVAASLGPGPAKGSLAVPWAPAVLPLAVLAALSLARVVENHVGPVRAAAVSMATVWVLLSGWDAMRFLHDVRREGRGASTARWVRSDLIRWLDNDAPPDAYVLASQPTLVLLHTGRPTRLLPPDSVTALELKAVLGSRPVVAVLTARDTLRVESLRWTEGMDTAIRGSEGLILIGSAPR